MTTAEPGTGPDEKLCPFCAEVIKSAAVKCRYCGSDLPEPSPSDASRLEVEPGDAQVGPLVDPENDPANAPESDPESDKESDPEIDPESDPEVDAEVAPEGAPEPLATDAPAAPAVRSGFDRVLAALVVLCLLLAAGLAAIVITSLPGDLDVADDGQVTSPSYRDEAMRAASSNAVTVLSYGYQHLDADMAATRKVVLPSYAKSDYDAPMAKLRPGILASKLTQSAKVLSVSLTSLTEDRAMLLLLANVTVVSGDKKGTAPQSLYRVQMTMQRKEGAWFVSNMSAL